MSILHDHTIASVLLTVKEKHSYDDSFTCVTMEGEEICVDLSSPSSPTTTPPLDLKNIVGKKIWVEWLQPYEWIAQAPRIYPEEEKKK